MNTHMLDRQRASVAEARSHSREEHKDLASNN
jgi:hypothetical protein